jgi:hypothetical protein
MHLLTLLTCLMTLLQLKVHVPLEVELIVVEIELVLPRKSGILGWR